MSDDKSPLDTLQERLRSLLDRDREPPSQEEVGQIMDDLDSSDMFPDGWPFRFPPQMGRSSFAMPTMSGTGPFPSFPSFADLPPQFRDDPKWTALVEGADNMISQTGGRSRAMITGSGNIVRQGSGPPPRGLDWEPFRATARSVLEKGGSCVTAVYGVLTNLASIWGSDYYDAARDEEPEDSAFEQEHSIGGENVQEGEKEEEEEKGEGKEEEDEVEEGDEGQDDGKPKPQPATVEDAEDDE